MHKPYAEVTGHICDFRVAYEFYSEEEGGRRSPVFQGYRSDFWYQDSGKGESQLFMIWPEFEDANGAVIESSEERIQMAGTARMWIINPEMRPYHQQRIRIGMEGFMREGGRKVAKYSVIEINGLQANSIDMSEKNH